MKTVGGIKGSNYEDIAEYLTNTNLVKPPRTDFVINKIKNEGFYKRAVKWAQEHRQEGQGKIRKRKNTYIRKFKPVIWERII